MNRTGKLALFVVIMMLLQTGLAGWPGGAKQAGAAAAGPVVLNLSPADDLLNVPINTDLKLTFDESVKKGPDSAGISIVESGTNRVLEKINVSSSRVVLEDSQRSARITLDKSTAGRKLELDTNYYVTVDAGAFANVSNGAAYAGISNASAWNFRTIAQVDNTRPVHVTRLPTGNSVAITSPLTITFDEPVFAASGSIQISSTEDNRSISVTSSEVTGSGTSTITVTPAAALQPDTAYTVTIPGTAFQDASGNLYVGSNWTFRTDVAPVNISSLSPIDNATSVLITSPLTITFDRNVQARADKYIEIRRVSNNTTFERFQATSSRISVTNNQVRITPSSNLEANTGYYVLIDAGAFTWPDPNGDQWYHGIASATVWNFTTDYGNDTSAPVLTGSTPLVPANNTSVSSTNTLLQMNFNEPVFPSSGTIDIRESVTGALFRSIPVTSLRVTGGGTYQITIDPNKAISGEAAKAFVNNTKYYVTIGNRAIRDAAGNYYSGITSSSSWTFTVTQDTIRPTLTLTQPLNNSTLVGVSSTFSATFSEPVMAGGGEIWFKPASGTIAPEVRGSFEVDNSNKQKINIIPVTDTNIKTSLLANTPYYVYIDASAITDLAGNSFAGILNEYQWAFRTFGSDTTPPVLSKTQWSGSTITLTYNETLNPDSVPSAGSFYVTVNGASRGISNVEIRGESVLLTLTSPIVAGQQVRLAYTKLSPTGQLQDLSGNEAASLALQDVAAAQDTTLPSLVSGTASGSAISLVFSKDLATVNSNAYLQFTVNVGGVNYSTTSISSTGKTVLLTVSGTIQNYQNVRVSYTPGAYALRDLAGNYLNTINNYTLYSVPDTTAPVLQSVTASGSVVTLTYNKTLNTASIPSTGQYSVLVDNVARSVVQVQVSGNGVFLTLSSAITTGQTVTVSYLASVTLVIDLAGNPAASFNNVSSSGASTGGGTGTGGTGTSGLYGAIAKGSALTLSFADTLSSGYIPPVSQFYVKANEISKPVASAAVNGNTVVLTLSSPIGVGEAVYITYYSSSTGLRTASGTTVASFSNVSVANQTTLLDSLSGDYEPAEGGGVGLKTTASITSSDSSPAGVQANRYTVLSDRITTAFQTARSAGMTTPRVVFKVPASERAAIVAVPISTLDAAYRLSGNSVFGIQYGDVTYELKLQSADFTRINTLLNGGSAGGQLLLRVDQGVNALTSSLNSKINSSNTQLLAGPYHFDVTAVNGSLQAEYNNFESYVVRTIRNYQTLDKSQSSVVWLDPQTGELSYVPTTFTTSEGKTVTTFQRKGNSAYALVRNGLIYTDVNKHWAEATIHALARKFIVSGRSVGTFDPDKVISRAEFAMYIAKGLGLEANKTEAAKYKDIPSNMAAAPYIGAASKAGIVFGNTDGTFKPYSPITRQDMAVMMIRAAKVAGLSTDIPQAEATYLQPFQDKGKISSYARTDVAKSIHHGIIYGKSTTLLSPLTNATRAEAAVMLKRLLEKAGFLSL
jgi:uncharacterized repeat protein (TIGR02059 family)